MILITLLKDRVDTWRNYISDLFIYNRPDNISSIINNGITTEEVTKAISLVKDVKASN